MWALPGGAALAFQFHPELTPGLVYDKIWGTLACNGRLDAAEAAEAEAQLQRGPAGVDSAAFLRVRFTLHAGPRAAAKRYRVSVLVGWGWG